MDKEEVKSILLSNNYQPVGHSLTCPSCGSKRTYVSCLFGAWLCLDCGLEFKVEDARQVYDVVAYEQDERIPEEVLEEVY